MKRGAIPTSWALGLGAAALALLYIRTKRVGEEADCYARVYNSHYQSMLASGATPAGAAAAADHAARMACRGPVA